MNGRNMAKGSRREKLSRVFFFDDIHLVSIGEYIHWILTKLFESFESKPKLNLVNSLVESLCGITDSKMNQK